MVVAEMLGPLCSGVIDDRAGPLETLRRALMEDLMGRKTADAQARHRLRGNDMPLSMLPLAKRKRVEEDLALCSKQGGSFVVDVEVALLPKSSVVHHPKGLRPISLLPLLRNLLGRLVLTMTGDSLAETGPWQFAYKSGYQVIDLTLLVNLMGQKCTEWAFPFILGVTDIPKCFDEVHHEHLLQTLTQKGVCPAITAWFLREMRATRLHMRVCGVEIDPVSASRGIPQGSQYGPRLCTAALHTCIEPVWLSCQRDGLGFYTDSGYIPFVLFCDNLFIFAHSAADFLVIYERLQLSLAAAGWRLPDDRLKYQCNLFMQTSRARRLEMFKEKPPGSSSKVLGSQVNANGTTHADVVFKRYVSASAIQMRSFLWKCSSAKSS